MKRAGEIVAKEYLRDDNLGKMSVELKSEQDLR